MQPGDVLVCVFINHYNEGETFEEWPLHVTLVPWFRLETDPQHFIEELAKALKTHQPFTDTVGEREVFSKREVNVLDKEAWQSLHETVLACVYNTAEPAARQFRFVADAYQPHVTVQAGAAMQQGEAIHVDAVYIVEQKGDYKQVAARVNL